MRRAAAAAILALAAACRRPAPAPATPEATALAAFSPGSAAFLQDGASADARRALRMLGEAADPRVVGTAALPGGGVAVDVEGSLGGGARGRYSLHVARGEDGAWRVVAIGGPGIAWPVRPPPGSEGLSESAPPR
ncbi:MAG TPA: hypothetical protein VF139_19100 [Candidatus Polarisedimenticolaceae bacterium]